MLSVTNPEAARSIINNVSGKIPLGLGSSFCRTAANPAAKAMQHTAEVPINSLLPPTNGARRIVRRTSILGSRLKNLDSELIWLNSIPALQMLSNRLTNHCSTYIIQWRWHRNNNMIPAPRRLLNTPHPNPDKGHYISRLFAKIAARYDFINNVISFGMHKRWRRIAVAMSGLNKGDSALDVATGTGDFAIELSNEVGAEGKVIGIDFCEPMLDIARRKTQGISNITFVYGDATKLPFADSSFNCCTIGFALRNVADVNATMSEMVRVIKPGGRVISLEIIKPPSDLIGKIKNFYFGKIMPKIARLFGGDKECYDYLPRSIEQFYTRDELAELFIASGLSDIKIIEFAAGSVCIHVGTKK